MFFAALCLSSTNGHMLRWNPGSFMRTPAESSIILCFSDSTPKRELVLVCAIARRYLPITPRLLPDIDDEEIPAHIFAFEGGLLFIEEAHDSGLPELAYGQAVYAIRADAVGGSGGLEPLVVSRPWARFQWVWCGARNHSRAMIPILHGRELLWRRPAVFPVWRRRRFPAWASRNSAPAGRMPEG